ncbi:MAG: helix-turn-helix domain-containing protein [Spirochaetaceae bacterium]|jgi:transcriptional regulator with XRE-family HTH domain|nr:helix-turn-helix domain-containing protein [Spirochaetaceae bacterium]
MDGQAIKAILGKNIKFLRTQRDFTQAVLAEKADISIIFLSSIERGTKYPKPSILARIAEALEVEVFELFKGDLVPFDSKEMMSRLSGDITSKINLALEDVFKQYLG